MIAEMVFIVKPVQKLASSQKVQPRYLGKKLKDVWSCGETPSDAPYKELKPGPQDHGFHVYSHSDSLTTKGK